MFSLKSRYTRFVTPDSASTLMGVNPIAHSVRLRVFNPVSVNTVGGIVPRLSLQRVRLLSLGKHLRRPSTRVVVPSPSSSKDDMWSKRAVSSGSSPRIGASNPSLWVTSRLPLLSSSSVSRRQASSSNVLKAMRLS